jgi:hypothetical protein
MVPRFSDASKELRVILEDSKDDLRFLMREQTNA